MATPTRPRCIRVQNIPCGTTREELKHEVFGLEDQSSVDVRSIAPAADGAHGYLTATATWHGRQMPRIVDHRLSIDEDFYGFTPLNVPQEPIVAESVPVRLALDYINIRSQCYRCYRTGGPCFWLMGALT